jgi:methionyl aminopeptidase
MAITIKNEQDIEKMRIAGKLASEVLDFITPYVKPGVTTAELDKLCHDYMVDVQKTIPAPLNYALLATYPILNPFALLLTIKFAMVFLAKKY